MTTGQQVLVGDERTRPQRYADALTAIARHALSAAPRLHLHPGPDHDTGDTGDIGEEDGDTGDEDGTGWRKSG